MKDFLSMMKDLLSAVRKVNFQSICLISVITHLLIVGISY